MKCTYAMLPYVEWYQCSEYKAYIGFSLEPINAMGWGWVFTWPNLQYVLVSWKLWNYSLAILLTLLVLLLGWLYRANQLWMPIGAFKLCGQLASIWLCFDLSRLCGHAILLMLKTFGRIVPTKFFPLLHTSWALIWMTSHPFWSFYKMVLVLVIRAVAKES